MKNRPIFLLAVSIVAGLALGATPSFGQSALGLSVNGQMIVPVGELESFVYVPAESRITAKSFFGDIRCSPGDQSATGGMVFELDKASDKEPEASYQVLSDGSVQYDFAAGVVNVATSGSSPSPNCVHYIPAVGVISQTGEADPGAFWVGNFENTFSLDATTISPAVIGSTLTIRFTLTNVSELLVGTDVVAQFISSVVPLDGGITGPSYSPAVGTTVVGDSWQIPILWPGESASIDVSYSLASQTAPGVDIETTVDSVTSLDRTGSAPLATGLTQITVVNTATAQ